MGNGVVVNIIHDLPKMVIVLVLLGILVGLIPLASCQPSDGGQPGTVPGNNCPVIDNTGEDMLDELVKTEGERRPIPPIDASTPTVTETATFALG